MSRYILGIDAGTSVVKAALFDRDFREAYTVSRRTTVRMPQTAWTEVSMPEVWAVTAEAIRTITAQVDARDIAAVALTGNMVGAWLLDAAFQPVRDAVLWSDGRTQALIDRFSIEKPGFMSVIFQSSGSVMQQGCTLPVLRWLIEHEPQTIARTRYVTSCKAWLIYNLTANLLLDSTEIPGMPGDIRQRDYSEAMFDWLEVRDLRDRFPPVVASDTLAGTITAEAAHVTGLAVGTPVIAGAGDVPASALGVGALEPGDACCLLGTNILNCLVTDAPIFEPADLGLSFCLPPDRWLRAMVNVAGTTNLDWVIATLFSAEEATASTRAALFATLEQIAVSSPPGSRGVLYLPYLSAAGIIAPVVNPGARAQFAGMTQVHTRADLLRAVYEGVALSIRDGFDAIPAAVESIRLSGGGSKSAFWSQMIADCTGRRVLVPGGSEFGARGAAALAAVALGWSASLADAVSVYRETGRVFQPEPASARAYDRLYGRYTRLREQLAAFWDSENAAAVSTEG